MEAQREITGRRFPMRHGLLAVLLVLGVILTEEACSNDIDIAGPGIDPPRPAIIVEPETVTFAPIRTLMGSDKRFNEISASVPEFGGYWMDDQGDIVVALTDLSRQSAVADLTRTELNDRIRGTNGTIHYMEVSRPFRQLLTWKETLTGRLQALGNVTFLDIDQTNNRLVIGLDDFAAASDVTDLAMSLGVPPNLIHTVVSGAAQPDIGRDEFGQVRHNHTLGSWFPQTLGGIRVKFSANPQDSCTLGLGVTIGSSERYITASHCSEWASLESSVSLHQPNTNQADRLGYELVDPSSTCTVNSPNNDDNTACRWSDAALYGQSTSNSRFVRGWVATTESASGSAALKHNHKNGDSIYVMVSEGGEIPSTQVSGQNVIKIGQAQGRRHGRVMHDCVDIYRWPTPTDNYTIRCQNLANYDRQVGDSGGPVFSSDGRFFGIHVGFFPGGNTGSGQLGAHSVYSPIANIEEDLGAMNTRGEEHLAFRIPVHVYRVVVDEEKPK